MTTQTEETRAEAGTPAPLSPEERDEQTLARLQQAFRAAGAASEPSEAGSVEPQQAAPVQPPEETETEQVELTPEQRQALLEYLLPEALESDLVKRHVLTEAQRLALEEQEKAARAAEIDIRLEQLAQQGQQAAQTIIEQVIQARKMLEDAEKGEIIDLSKAPDPQTVGQAILQVAAAMSSRTMLDVADAVGVAQQYALQDLSLPEEEINRAAKVIGGYVAEAQQLRNDPQNADLATAYMFTGVLRTIAALAKEAGKREAQAELGRKQPLAKGLADSNAIAAAQAIMSKLKLPREVPSTVAPASPAGASPDALMEQYREAKRAGNAAEADRIAVLIARRARSAGMGR